MKPWRPYTSWVSAIGLGLCIFALAGCAHQPPRRRIGVNIDRRPTPLQPDSSLRPPAPAARPRAVVMSTQTRRDTRAVVIADTTLARALLLRCDGKKLLPDQEGVFDATTRLLIDARRALGAGDLQRARSIARQAKQLAGSIGCRGR